MRIAFEFAVMVGLFAVVVFLGIYNGGERK